VPLPEHHFSGRHLPGPGPFPEYVGKLAAKPLYQMLQRLDRDILLAHLHAMQRRRRDTKPPSEGRIGHLPTSFSQELPKLLLQGRCHAGSLPPRHSHIWEISLVFACIASRNWLRDGEQNARRRAGVGTNVMDKPI